jgi:acyl-CoA thioester hydrolase
MGYMYYGNYAEFYEVGRVEMLRSLGLTYSGMEESGIKMPVLELKCKYLKPALYDEEITVRVIMEKMPSIRIVFRYELFNEKEELINTGETLLVFVNMQTNRPCLPSQDFLDRLKPFFE